MSGEGINLLCFHHKAVTILSRTVSHCKLLHCTMPASGNRPDILSGRVGSTVSAIPHRGPTVDALLSITPHRPLSQAWEQGLGRVGQLEPQASWARDGALLPPHAVREAS